MRSKKTYAFHIFALMLMSFFSTAVAFRYVVKDGDNLTKIAQTHLGKPVYSADGSLKKILQMNPQIKNPNLIFPGDVINLNSVIENRDLASNERDNNETTSLEISETSESKKEKDSSSFKDKSLVIQEKTNLSSKVEVDMGLLYLRIDATDNATFGKTTILSNASPELSLIWRQYWSDQLNSFLKFKYLTVNLQDPSPRVFNSSQKNATGFEIGLSNSLSDRLYLNLSAGLEQKFFVRNISTNTLTLDALVLPILSAGVDWSIVEKNPFKLGLKADYKYLGSTEASSYDVRSGNVFRGAVYLTQNFSSWSSQLSGLIYYERREQNSSILEQSESNIGFNFGMKWNFGP